MITDEDIDAIISRGKARTEETNKKLKKQANNLANFSFDAEEKDIYDFMGVDYSSNKARRRDVSSACVRGFVSNMMCSRLILDRSLSIWATAKESRKCTNYFCCVQ